MQFQHGAFEIIAQQLRPDDETALECFSDQPGFFLARWREHIVGHFVARPGKHFSQFLDSVENCA